MDREAMEGFADLAVVIDLFWRRVIDHPNQPLSSPKIPLASNRTVRYASERKGSEAFGAVRMGEVPVALAIKVNEETFTPRQQAVLTAALDLLVENGDGLTMTAVARRASCSKETLYKWFGDRDGLLTATVQWQAAKVRMPYVDRSHINLKALRGSLEQFARDLLTTIIGEVSITLNRTAITHAAQEKDDLGNIVLENGPMAIRRRLKPILEAARDARLLRFPSSEEAYRTFFGLVVRDVQIRLLLGDKGLTQSNVEANIEADVKAAADQFLALYGAKANS